MRGKNVAFASFFGSPEYTPSTFVPFSTTSAPTSIARSTAAVSVVKYGLPVPAAITTIRPFSRWRTARRRIHGSHTWSIWIADMTRVYSPRFSSACCIDRLLITVASMPMWSAATRSIPRALPASPRKMLPPPSTMPTCTPNACTSPTSSAMRESTCSSMPCPASPASSSPESLSRMRCGFPFNGLLGPEAEAGEAADDDVLAGLRRHLFDQVADDDLVVFDERLLHQAHLAEELVELAVHDLVRDRRRLALVLHLLLVDRALALDALGRDLLPAHVVGASGGHLHGEVSHEHAEVVGSRHEVSLAVDLDQHAYSVVVDVRLHAALRRGAPGARLGLRDARLAQRVDRLVQVAAHLGQRLLALHHPRPGHLPELLHQVRGDRHVIPLLVGTPARGLSGRARGSSCAAGLRLVRAPLPLRPRPSPRRTTRFPDRRPRGP